jgi:hypothetical protein
MLSPMLIATICLIFQKGSIRISILITAIIELYPLVDPLGTIFFVKPYYNSIFGRRNNKLRKQTIMEDQQSEPPESSEGLTSSV